VVFAILWIGVSSRVRLQVDVVSAFHPPAQGISWLVTLLWWVTSAGTVILVIAAAAYSHRVEIFRDLGLSAAMAWVGSVAVQHLFGEIARFPASGQELVPGVDLGFPVPAPATMVAVILASLPYLSRHLQRLLLGLIAVAMLSGLMKGVGLPAALLASVVVGWSVVAITHLIFGSPTGVPDAGAIQGLLRSLGIAADGVEPVVRQEWGLAASERRPRTGVRCGSRSTEETPAKASCCRSSTERSCCARTSVRSC
jgi:undecaprenyl-diphosphatase